MMKMTSCRLAINTRLWSPHTDQWLAAAAAIQQEEQERISRFVFRKDAKSAMAGRLLIRKAINNTLGIGNSQIILSRTDKGKPYLVNFPSHLPHFNFNVSHQGAYAVIASEPHSRVGIDVMEIEFTRNKSTEEFFSTMDRQFTAKEWEAITRPCDEWEQLSNFYRYWCLKESFVKAVGDGIGFSLKRLEFQVNSALEYGLSASDTKIYIDGKLSEDWIFHETKLDTTHCVAVALQEKNDHPFECSPKNFTILNAGEVLSSLEPIREVREQFWQEFSEKEEKPG